MIYSVGYQKMTPQGLVKLCDKLDIGTVVDARSKPVSRRPGFGRRQLEELLTHRYAWKGDVLGGMAPGVTSEGVNYLQKVNSAAEVGHILLLCLEEAPGECHRHHDIAPRLLKRGIDVHHIFQDHIVKASELQRSIDDDDDYESEDL